MARLARYFVEGQPQHIIQRGNNREVQIKGVRPLFSGGCGLSFEDEFFPLNK